MGFLVGVLMVALVVGFVWIRIAGTRALNRHVFSRSQHEQGQDQTGRDLVMTSTAPVQPLREAIDRTVRAVTEVPRGVSADLYRAAVTDDSTVYAYGTRMSTIFKTLVQVTPSASGSRVLVQVTEWHNSDGVTTHSDVMKRIRDDVLAAVRAVDPAATEELVESH